MSRILRTLSVSMIASAALLGCGGGGGDEDSKSLFSLWTRDGDNVKLDLNGLGFGTGQYMYVITPDATKCICEVSIIGNESSGTAALTGCISTPYSSARNAQCEASNTVANYTYSQNVLTLGNANGTFTYR